MFGTTGDSCVNLLSYKSVNFLFLCTIVLQSIYNLFLGSRYLDLRRPALYSLMKSMQLEVLDMMMDQGVAMKFSVLCLKL
jgi:hypothetical protein